MRSLSPMAKKVLETHFLKRDSLNRVSETPRDLFRRVARHVGKVEAQWSTLDEVEYYEKEYIHMMEQLEFLPNTPALLNAGKETGQLASCFVLPVPDSIDGITKAVHQMMKLHQNGGGTGFSFSSVRPASDQVISTGGVASGPVEFIKVFDAATEVTHQGGCRQGANMAVLRVDHPDILDFVQAKKSGDLKNFNLSVAVSSHFMRCLKKGTTYPLINPRNGKITRFIPARQVFDVLCENACQYGDPGLVFIDEINRHNPTPEQGKIEATNPCGDQPLLPHESCHLGSLNLSRMVENGEFNEERFEIVIDLAIRFLDNMIDANHYFFSEIEQQTKANRKVGLGIMGFSELLMKMGMDYDSPKARSWATSMMKLFLKRCRQASVALAKQRGPFPNYNGSALEKNNLPPIRNATLTTMSPTRTLSMIAGTTNSIEPADALCFYRHGLDGEESLEVLPEFRRQLEQEGLLKESVLVEVARTGSAQKITRLPKPLRNTFKVGTDMDAEAHIKMEAVFQKYTDNGVSKNIGLPNQASPKDVMELFMSAYEQKCKSIAVCPRSLKSKYGLYTITSQDKNKLVLQERESKPLLCGH